MESIRDISFSIDKLNNNARKFDNRRNIYVGRKEY